MTTESSEPQRFAETARLSLRLLGRDMGGCTEACSEGHTYSAPCEQSMVITGRPPRRLGFRFVFAWYDLWVGVFVDRRRRRIYVFPVPCLGFVLSWQRASR